MRDFQGLERRIRSEKKRADEITLKQEQQEVANVEVGKNPWPVYERDAQAYIDSFEKSFPDIKALPNRLRAFHEKGDTVVVVDLCGAANGHSIGADHTVALTLKKWPDFDEEQDQTVIEGDVFKSGPTQEIIDAVKTHGGKIHCIFLRPVGGLSGHGYNMRSHLRLYSALQKLYPYLAEGGDAYIDLVGFQGSELFGEIMHSQSNECTIEESRRWPSESYYIDSFHIKKTEGASGNLLTLEEIRNLPGMETRVQEVFST